MTRTPSHLIDALAAEYRPPTKGRTPASDPSNAPDWYAKIFQVEWKTPPPLGVGSEIAFVARFLGRELRYTYRIIEHTPESLVMRALTLA